MENKILFSKSNAAAALDVSLRTVDNLIQRGVLPVKKVGKRTLIHRDDLVKFANAGTD